MQRLVPQLLERAAEILGGYYALASFLGVAEHSLRFWQHGRAKAPESVVFTLVDLVLKDDMARAHEDRREQPRTIAPPNEIGV